MGFWILDKDGEYRFDGSGDDWTNSIDDEYIHEYGDGWKYDLDANFTAIHDEYGNQLSKLGYYNITDNLGWGMAGSIPVINPPFNNPPEGRQH